MTPDQLFGIVNLVALVAWVLLALTPWVPRLRTVTAAVVPLALAVVYATLVAVHWSSSEGGFSSLPDVAALFTNPWVLLAGWTHYLVFDLLVGNWEMQDASAREVPYLLVVPCLLLTFLFGPAGWLLYMLVRQLRPAPAVSA